MCSWLFLVYLFAVLRGSSAKQHRKVWCDIRMQFRQSVCITRDVKWAKRRKQQGDKRFSEIVLISYVCCVTVCCVRTCKSTSVCKSIENILWRWTDEACCRWRAHCFWWFDDGSGACVGLCSAAAAVSMEICGIRDSSSFVHDYHRLPLGNNNNKNECNNNRNNK